MTISYVLDLFREAMTLAIMLSTPVLAVSLIVGLAVSFFQALTQIHEMTLTFVPKLLGMVVVLALLGSWMLQNMLRFAEKLFTSLAHFAA
ncbi:MAG TPA: flagellar biosynthesis protein FliQ [Chloroflexi bacterium]|jgi:flagellar biosynthetic protein FliQ|nr:flagellar biosynthesis protein FliQ [Chloroflexota bacterium]